MYFLYVVIQVLVSVELDGPMRQNLEWSLGMLWLGQEERRCVYVHSCTCRALWGEPEQSARLESCMFTDSLF